MAAKGVLPISLRQLACQSFLLSALVVMMVSPVLRGQDMQEPDPQELSHEANETLQRGDAALAVREYYQLLQTHPEIVTARANLATALVSLGRFDEAITQYQLALKEAPSNSSLRFNLGITYFRKGDFRQATEQFAALYQKDPSNVRVATLLANCELHLSQVAQAIALLEPLEKANPDNLDLEWTLGMALTRAGRPREALKRVQKVANQGHNAEAYQLAAILHMGLTDFDMARRDAETAIRINPHASNAYLALAMLNGYSGNEKGAVEEYEKALQANPKNLQAHIQLGVIFYNERKLDDAKQQFTDALALNPKSFLALYQMARVERAQGHTEAAVKNLQSCVRENPQWLPPHIELAAIYYQLKRPEDGAKEKQIIQQLMAEKQRRGPAPDTVSPLTPLP